MSDFDDDVAPLTFPCPDCDYESSTKLALGAHRKRKHGTPGTGKTARKRTAAPRAPRERPASARGGRASAELATALRDAADDWKARNERCGTSLDRQADEIATAAIDYFRAVAPVADRLTAIVDVDKKGAAELAELVKAGLPVAAAFGQEYIAPRLFGMLRNLFRRRRRLEPLTDPAGNPILGPDGAPVVIDPKTEQIFSAAGEPLGTLAELVERNARAQAVSADVPEHVSADAGPYGGGLVDGLVDGGTGA